MRYWWLLSSAEWSTLCQLELASTQGSGMPSRVWRPYSRVKSQESELAGPSKLAETPSNRRVAAGPAIVPDEIQEVLERLTAIERKLSMRPAIVHELQPLDRLRTPDTVAIRAAMELKAVDREAFEFDLHMRTMHEIVERFGYPTKAGACADNCEVYWRYELPSANPESPNYFCVYFTGSLVTWTESRWTG